MAAHAWHVASIRLCTQTTQENWIQRREVRILCYSEIIYWWKTSMPSVHILKEVWAGEIISRPEAVSLLEHMHLSFFPPQLIKTSLEQSATQWILSIKEEVLYGKRVFNRRWQRLEPSQNMLVSRSNLHILPCILEANGTPERQFNNHGMMPPH